jgi:prepilin-type N-terminal cleavage/methylation domain-containing protein
MAGGRWFLNLFVAVGREFMITKPKSSHRFNSGPSGARVGIRSAFAGFTLLEMLGVLAILAILAAIAIPIGLRQLDIAATDRESANLASYATALQNSILRNRYIPGTNEMALSIATATGVDIKDINVNFRNNPRVFLVDPLFQVGVGKAKPPFQQDITGCGFVGTNGYFSSPINPRLMIISNLGPIGLPDLSGIDFNVLWNWADGSVPNSGVWAGWKGDSVIVQRINLSPLFAHLILYNYGSTNQGLYSIDGSAPTNVPNLNPVGNPTNGIDAYFLKGTVLDLLSGVSSGSINQAKQIVTRDTSFAYVQQVWQSSMNLGSKIDSRSAMIGNALWSTAAAFVASPYNSKAVSTPPQVVNDMSTFMNAYVNWANGGFLVSGPAYTAASAAQSVLFGDMNNLGGTFVEGGCTNAPLVGP